MKKILSRWRWRAVGIVALFGLVFLFSLSVESIYGTSVFDNAKEFYLNTGQDENGHIKAENGEVYFATKARLAKTRSSYKTYVAVGFDVTLTGNGKSVDFVVKRGGSLENCVQDIVQEGESYYVYNLYRISSESLYSLAKATGNPNADTVLSASTIVVDMDAILTIRENGTEGDIYEDGKGGATEAAPIYHLRKSSHLAEMKGIFSGTTFSSYIGIRTKLINYSLTAMYSVGDDVVMNSGYTTKTYTNGSTSFPNVLYKDGTVVQDKKRVVEKMTLLNSDLIGLKKTGYHLDNNAEWITVDRRVFSAGETYEPKEILPETGYGNKSVVFYTNWKPNTFTIKYDANGGSGTMVNTGVTYGTSVKTTQNMFSKKGHTFTGWYLYRASDSKWLYTNGSSTAWYTESAVPSGYYKKMCAGGASVSAETEVHKDTITFYAQWSPNIYTIILDNQGADSAGTTAYYEKYSKGNYTTKACSATISTIIKPEKKGYTFKGYYTGKDGTGKQYINALGTITATNSTFDSNVILYAKWAANKYTIKHNANGGSGFMDDIIATYGEERSLGANMYTRTGYTFAGWATSPTGGVVYLDKESVLNLSEKNGDIITLYAVWEPIVVYVGMDAQGGSGGTQFFYQKYENGFFSSEFCTSTSEITGVTAPIRAGYTLQGFWDDLAGKGTPILSPLGLFLIENTYFLYDTVVYADWKANTYIVTFDMQDGNNGTDSVKATYDKLFPMKDTDGMAVEAPIRDGYTFTGYFTEKNGAGQQVYNEHMATDVIYKYEKNITLYAHWIDDILPEVELNVSSNAWTNQEVKLTAIARDEGIGLGSVVIYCVAQDGTETQVVSATGLNGTQNKELTFTNKTEGVIRYKAVATDMKGNSVESYNVVYYDKTNPVGEVTDERISENTFYLEIEVTDINTGN